MPAKKQKGQKLDASKLFGGSQEDNLDWAAGHNYDEPDPADVQAGTAKPKSPNADDRHVAITKAASFGNFRDEAPKAAGVPDDMPPPFVAFVKTFGRSVTDTVMRSYFPEMDIKHVLIINSENALYAFIEFGERDDLRAALNVTGAKMMFQYPCTVDVASPGQIEKFSKTMNRNQPRSMRSPKTPNKDAPQFNFDRDSFQTGEQPDANLDDLIGAEEGGNSGRGGRGGRGGGGFRGMSKSASANFDQGRDAIFGSAEPVPPAADAGAEGGDSNSKAKGPGRFGGSRITTSAASADFSRDSLFATRETPATSNISPGASPNPTGRSQFGRNASKESIDGASSDAGASSNGGDSKKEAPAFSRDMFGGADVPAMKENAGEEKEGDNKPRGGNGGGRGRGGNNNNNSSNGDRFARRSPTTDKPKKGGDDAGDRFANFRSGKKEEAKDATPPPPPPPKASPATGNWRDMMAAK